MLWGTEGYKRHLGAHPLRGTRLSVFRCEAARLLSLDETVEIHYRRRKDYYWRSRHAVGTVVRAAVGRPRGDDEVIRRTSGSPGGDDGL
jgi:hypothetical protein